MKDADFLLVLLGVIFVPPIPLVLFSATLYKLLPELRRQFGEPDRSPHPEIVIAFALAVLVIFCSLFSIWMHFAIWLF